MGNPSRLPRKAMDRLLVCVGLFTLECVGWTCMFACILVLVRVRCPLGVVEYQWVQGSELRSLGLSASCI